LRYTGTVNELIIFLMSLSLHTVHITFDDGPNLRYTDEILTLLKEEHVKANFFMVGRNIEMYPHMVKRVVNEGHDIGGHSMTHKELTKIPFDQAKLEIYESMMLVNMYQDTKLFRFPYGSFDKRLSSYVKSLGYKNIYWDVDTTDWKYKDKDVIYKKFKVRIAEAKDGAIILMHDIHPQTVGSLRMIIDYLKERKIVIKKLDR